MQQKFSILIAFLILLCPQWTMAHNMIKGGNDFYNGLLHPFFSLPHLMVTLTLGILLGLQNKRNEKSEKRNTIITWGFLAFLAIGLGCAIFSLGFPSETYLLFGAGVLGLMLVLGRPLPLWIYAPLAFSLALLMGLDFSSEDAKSKAAMNTGVGICLYFCFIYASILSENFSNKKWQQIGFRVLGSWIAACAMLVLSLSIFIKKS